MPYYPPPVERPYIEEVQRAPGRLRIALMPRPIIPLEVHAECLTAVHKAAKLCADLGHEVEEAAPAVPAEEYYDAVVLLATVGTLATVTAREKVLGRKVTDADLEPITREWVQQGRQVTGLQYAQARETFQRVGGILGRFHQQYDLILNPTMASPPARLGQLSLSTNLDHFMQAGVNASVYTQLFNVTGQPSMSVPLHWSADGLPVGVMFSARFGDEATLFRLAAQLERASPWFDRLPTL